MKMKCLPLLTLLFQFAIFLPIVSSQEYNTWGLPEGAIARLGKGEITGNVAFSPDGNRLAVASSIGIWIYNVSPGNETELELIIGHTFDVTTLAYSPDVAYSQVVMELSECGIYNLRASLASSSFDGTILLWKLR